MWLSTASTELRAAAVLACYCYHADAHGLAGPYQRLFTSRGKRFRSRYIPMLAGVGRPRTKDRPIYTVRCGNLAATPVLLPTQVSTFSTAALPKLATNGPDPHPGCVTDCCLPHRLKPACGSGKHCHCATTTFTSAPGPHPISTPLPARTIPAALAVKRCGARRTNIGDDLEALYSSYVWHLVDHGADLAVRDLDTHFVFVNLTTGVMFAPMRPETVHAKVDSLTKRSGGRLPQGWSPHWLRHTHATALLLSGAAPTW